MSETLKVVILWERLSTTIYAYFPSIISNASAHFDIEMSPSIDKSNDWYVIGRDRLQSDWKTTFGFVKTHSKKFDNLSKI